MSEATPKKFNQTTLPFVSSLFPNKRKLENDINHNIVVEETKSRKMNCIASPKHSTAKVFRDMVTDKVYVVGSIPNTNSEFCPGISKSKAVDTQNMNVDFAEAPTDQIPMPNILNDKSVCDDKKVDVFTRINVNLNAVESTLLNVSQQPRNSEITTYPEFSPDSESTLLQTKKLTRKPLQIRKQEAEARRIEHEKLKQKKEKEQLEKKEEKERKRLAEIEAKNEEIRRQKEERKMKEKNKEQRRQKEAESKAKEDERRRKIEEFRSREEQEKKNEEIVAALNNFVVYKNETNVPEVQLTENSNNDPASISWLFIPFEVKENMKSASVTQATFTPERKKYLDSVVREDILDNDCSSYLAQLKSKNYKLGHSGPVIDENFKDDNLLRTRYRCKLLQFHENRRPAYWGTWRKLSKTISGKTPFKRDSKFEYDIDSDEEWVEGYGESLLGSDDEEESDNEYVIDNKMFVPHGYLSDEEVQQDNGESHQNYSKKLDLLKTEFEAELKEKTFKLKLRSYGCTWIANYVQAGANDTEQLLLSFRAVYNYSSTPFLWKSEGENVLCGSSGSSAPLLKAKFMKFPEQFLPDFIRLAHGNKISAKNLAVKFAVFIRTKQMDLNVELLCVKRKLKEIAHWDKFKQSWYVRDEILQRYSLEELSCKAYGK